MKTRNKKMSVKRKFLLTAILILFLTVLPSCMKSNEDSVLTDTDSTYSDTTNEAENYFLSDETQTNEETSAETQTTTQTETTAEKATTKTITQTKTTTEKTAAKTTTQTETTAEKTTVKTTTQTTTKTETTTKKATTSKRETTTEKATTKTTTVKATQCSGASYILNTNTKKFHYPNCASVDRMSESNKKSFYGSRDEIIAQGYVPCKNCNP